MTEVLFIANEENKFLTFYTLYASLRMFQDFKTEQLVHGAALDEVTEMLAQLKDNNLKLYKTAEITYNKIHGYPFHLN